MARRLSPLSLIALLASISLVVVATAASFAAGPPSTEQPQGLRDVRVDRHLLKGARVVVAPGETLDNADVLIESGQIRAVGSGLVAPPGCEIHDLTGKTIYAGLIDAYSEAKSRVESPAAAPYWNPAIRPELHAAESLAIDTATKEKLRKQGFVAQLTAPTGGILKGISCVATLGDSEPGKSLLVDEAFQHVRLTADRSGSSYPRSPMGAVALARQAMYDAEWHAAATKVAAENSALVAPEPNDSLTVLADWRDARRPFLAEGLDEQYFLRADAYGREFDLNLVILGSGREYRRLAEIAATKRLIVLPVAFPAPPDVRTLEGADAATLAELMHWDHAPENPARLFATGARICFTSAGLKDAGEFLKQIRVAVDRGLPADAALAGLTTTAAELLGVDDSLGRVEPGKRASLVVADGDLFAKKTKIVETWIDGERFAFDEKKDLGLAGAWKISSTGDPKFSSMSLLVEGDEKKPSAEFFAWPLIEGEEDPPKLEDVAWRSPSLTARFDGKAWKRPGQAFLSLAFVAKSESDEAIDGRIVWSDGSISILKASKTDPPKPKEDAEKEGDASEPDDAAKPDEGDDSRDENEDEDKDDAKANVETDDADERAEGESSEEKSKPDEPAADFDPKSSFPTLYPFMAYGRETPPESAGLTMFENATVWTCDERGVLEEADVLIGSGKILAVGVDLAAPAGTKIVDASGRHLTPGLIDCHSHIATDGGVNEATQAITAEVRIADFIDANEPAIYEQLAGGVTTVNVLHGSANPIGGQNQVLKLRWGATPEELKFAEAPSGIKFALGENVKQSNWDEPTSRYPKSRMGVPELFADAFQGAQAYRLDQAERRRSSAGLPVRFDLEKEALAEILEGKRWIHCHSYRQDEILALLSVLDQFQVTVGTLQHILEGYKVADAMAEHGAMGSSFSDWWAYKVEVWDAIPYNGALMHRAGVCVSFNSDDRELARRLNVEAAKAMKYGDVPPEEALKFVTLNPARQLRIDAYVGSIAAGKQADLTLWTGPPLSAFSRAEQTWIDGRKYFDRVEDAELRRTVRDRKAALVAKVLASGQKPRKPGEREEEEADNWERYDSFCGHDHGEHDHQDHDHSAHAHEGAN